MKLFGHLLLPALLFLTHHAQCQLPAKGYVRLYDAHQRHHVTIIDGTRLTGRVLGHNDQFLRFLYQGSELAIPISDIKLIEPVGEETIHAPPTATEAPEPMGQAEKQQDEWHFDYKVTNTLGKERMGKLVQISSGIAILVIPNEEAPHKKYLLRNVAQIQLLGKRIPPLPTELKEYHRMTLRNGNRLIGQLLRYNGTVFEFLLKNGSTVHYLKEEVVSIQLEKNASSNPPIKFIYPARQYYFSQQRVMFSPSALVLEKGVKEYRSLLVFHNTLDYGLAENITIGAGISTVLSVNAVSGKVKMGGSLSPFLHVAVGVQGIYIFPSLGDDAMSKILLYGAVNIGTKEKFLTASIGLGKDQYGERAAGFSLGGSLRTTENWRIFLEFMHFNPVEALNSYSYKQENTNMGSVGLSWLKRNHQLDFGFFSNNHFSDAGNVALPMIAYSFRF